MREIKNQFFIVSTSVCSLSSSLQTCGLLTRRLEADIQEWSHDTWLELSTTTNWCCTLLLRPDAALVPELVGKRVSAAELYSASSRHGMCGYLLG